MVEAVSERLDSLDSILDCKQVAWHSRLMFSWSVFTLARFVHARPLDSSRATDLVFDMRGCTCLSIGTLKHTQFRVGRSLHLESFAAVVSLLSCAMVCKAEYRGGGLMPARPADIAFRSPIPHVSATLQSRNFAYLGSEQWHSSSDGARFASDFLPSCTSFDLHGLPALLWISPFECVGSDIKELSSSPNGPLTCSLRGLMYRIYCSTSA